MATATLNYWQTTRLLNAMRSMMEKLEKSGDFPEKKEYDRIVKILEDARYEASKEESKK